MTAIQTYVMAKFAANGIATLSSGGGGGGNGGIATLPGGGMGGSGGMGGGGMGGGHFNNRNSSARLNAARHFQSPTSLTKGIGMPMMGGGQNISRPTSLPMSAPVMPPSPYHQ